MILVSLNKLQAFDKTLTFPLEGQNEAQFLNALAKVYPHFQSDEKIRSLKLVSDPTSCLFLNWLDELHFLLNTLETKQLTLQENIEKSISEHVLFPQFQAFLAPTLFPILEEKLNEKDSNLGLIMNYLIFLPLEDAGIIQDKIAQKLNKNIALFKQKCLATTNELELWKLVTQLLDKNNVAIINRMDQAHYFIIRNTVDATLELMYHAHATNRLIHNCLKQLQLLNLLEEHSTQIKLLEKKFLKGEISVQKVRVPWKKFTFVLCSLLLVVGAIFLLFLWKPKTTVQVQQETTSFMHLSQNERLHLDSLLQQVKKQNEAQGIDQALPFVGVELVPKQDLDNSKMQDLIQSWKANDTLKKSAFYSKTNSQRTHYISTSLLSKKKGEMNMEMHNNSKTLALIMVFSEKSNTLYSQYVLPQHVIRWKQNTTDLMLILPGNNVQVSQTYRELPFQEFKEDFFDQLNQIYRIRQSTSKTIKLVWETYNDKSYLLDLSQSIEKE